MAHLFICPNCGNRTTATERTSGFRNVPKGCSKCGFGFLFELLDDYYPAPNAAFFACDQQGRLIHCGRGSFELTGLDLKQVIGRPAREAAISADERPVFARLQLITAKPMMYVLNVEEAAAATGNAHSAEAELYARKRGILSVVISAAIEA